MNFGEIIKELNDNNTVARKSWPYGKFIVKQIPQTISPDIVPRMTSLPNMAKVHIGQCDGSITYHDQVIQINKVVGKCDATYYIPSWEDIFAEDWAVMLPDNEINKNN